MTDNTPQNECTIVHCFYFLAIIILVPTGLLHGPDVLFYIGAGLFLLPFAASILAFAVGTLAMTVLGVVLLLKNPIAGVPMAMVFVGLNIIMIATHDCPTSLFTLLFGCVSATGIPIWINSIWYLCRTSYYQRNAIVLEALVVNRFTEENNPPSWLTPDNTTSSLNYYWVGEYEAPSLQDVKPNSDEKRTTIQLFHNGDQQGAETNGLEECCKEEEEVCYKMQQRFQKKFLVTVDLYQAASLEFFVLPGRPNQAMLTKPLEDKRREAKFLSIYFFFHVPMFSVPGIVIPLKILIASRSDKYGPDDLLYCSQIVWQTYVPYISLLLMAMLSVTYVLWNECQKGEFEAVTVHPAGEQELTVVGPQKKKEHKYHHINDDATACTRELDYDDETVCTRELDNDGETACTREPVGTGRNRAFLV